jgi:hypothetical protein
MKLLNLIILTILYSTCFGQIDLYSLDDKYPKPIVEFREELTKVFLEKSRILIPFKENEKWGYMDYHTKEILVSPKADGLNIIQTDIEQSSIGVMTHDGQSFHFFIENSEATIFTFGPPMIGEWKDDPRDSKQQRFIFVEINEDSRMCLIENINYILILIPKFIKPIMMHSLI